MRKEWIMKIELGSGRGRGDLTIPFDIIMEKECTLKEVIDEMLYKLCGVNKHYKGYFKIRDNVSSVQYTLRYKNCELETDLPEEYGRIIVKKAWGNGNLEKMNFEVEV